MAIAALPPTPSQPSFARTTSRAPQNDAVLEEVVNAIALGQESKDMTLLVIRCNYARLQETVLAELLQWLTTEDLQGAIHTLRLNCFPHTQAGLSGEDLINQLRAITQADHPGAVMVLGLEAIHKPEKLLETLNQGREQLRRQFAFPILLWVTDRGYGLLSQYANDLESISGGTTLLIQPALCQLQQQLQAATRNLFEILLQPHQTASIEQRLPEWDSGELQRDELAIALAELQAHNYPISPELQADITFAQGLQSPIETSAPFFEQSATYWQEYLDIPHASLTQTSLTSMILRRGLALYFLGCARYEAASHVGYQNPNWTAAMAPLNECLSLFRQSDRPDLVALCSPQLEHLLHHLGHWDALEQLIHQVQPLHQIHSDAKTLAQDYGFLAHIALHRQQWQQAADLTQHAMQELIQGGVEQSWWRMLYLKMLAEAQTALGNRASATQQLQAAAAMGVMDHPKLYSEVLCLLQQHLRDQGRYLEAFAAKQKRLLIEKQYGLRAFIGAVRLRDQRLESHPMASHSMASHSMASHPMASHPIANVDDRADDHTDRFELEAMAQRHSERSIAPEIAVSGRAHDLTELLNRIAGKIHKLIVIHGTSGVGKSSLVNGGLIPALQARALQNRTNIPVMIQQYTHWQQELLDALTTALAQTVDGLAILQEGRRPTAADQNSNLKIQTSNLKPQTSITPNAKGDATQTLHHSITPPLHHSITPPLHHLLTPSFSLLQDCDNYNLRPILIFDQFEEFFFAHPDPLVQQDFFQFIADCLELPGALKVVVSLRQDYLHNLLEAKQLVKRNQWPQSSMARSQLDDILSKHILYQIGNLSPEDARAIIQQLTARTRMRLESTLVEALVEDLAEPLQEVRPIELQIVGAQLQTEGIHTLTRYRELGDRPKETLVERYLNDVVMDCGDPETQQLAELVLLLLTDERGTRPLKTRSQLEREFMALSNPESNLFLGALADCLTQVPQISKLQHVISRLSDGMTRNQPTNHDFGSVSNASRQNTKLDQILYILCQSGVVCYLPDGGSNGATPLQQEYRYQLVHDYIAEMIRAKKAPQIYQLVTDLEQERTQRKRIEQQKKIIEAEKRRLKQANTLLTQAKIKAGKLLLNSLFFSIVISNIFIVIVFLWFYNFAPQKTVNLLREDMRSTLKAAASGLDVEELIALYQNGQRNHEGFSNDPRYANQLEWFLTVNRIEPRAWLYSFVITGPPHLEQIRPLSDKEFKQIPIEQHQTTWLVDLWAAYPDYRHERAAQFLYTQQGTSSIAALVKYQHRIVEVPNIYEDKWGAWLSAFAPLEDRDGKVVAILGLDLEANHVFVLQRTIRNNIITAFLVTQSSFFLVYLILWKRVQTF